jgi:hypothetical protein
MPTDAERPDRHTQRHGVYARTGQTLRDTTQATLAERDWTLNEFIIAAMELVNRNPDAMLARLAKYRPTIPKGRPSTSGKKPATSD